MRTVRRVMHDILRSGTSTVPEHLIIKTCTEQKVVGPADSPRRSYRGRVQRRTSEVGARVLQNPGLPRVPNMHSNRGRSSRPLRYWSPTVSPSSLRLRGACTHGPHQSGRWRQRRCIAPARARAGACTVDGLGTPWETWILEQGVSDLDHGIHLRRINVSLGPEQASQPLCGTMLVLCAANWTALKCTPRAWTEEAHACVPECG